MKNKTQLVPHGCAHVRIEQTNIRDENAHRQGDQKGATNLQDKKQEGHTGIKPKPWPRAEEKRADTHHGED